MKRLDRILGGKLSGRFRGAVIATAIAAAPIGAYARGGGGGSGGGLGHMGGGGFSHAGGAGFSHMGGGVGLPHVGSAGGFVSGGNFSHMGGIAPAGGVAGGGIMNNPSHIPAVHRGDTLGNVRGGASQLAHGSQGLHNAGTNASRHAYIYHRFANIEKRGDRFGDFRFRRDRLFRTRDLLVGLVDFGWPINVVDNWCDAIGDDEIEVGMPAELVLDYWGDPILVNTLTLPSGVGQVWTYRSPTDGTVRVTIMNDRVTSVQQV